MCSSQQQASIKALIISDVSQEDGSLGKDLCHQAQGPCSGAHIEREENQGSQIVL